MRTSSTKPTVKRDNELRFHVREDVYRISRKTTLGCLYIGVPLTILSIIVVNLPGRLELLGAIGLVLAGICGVVALVMAASWFFQSDTLYHQPRAS